MPDEKHELTTLQRQSMFVAKSNELIQQSRFSLSLEQSKFLLYLISKIKPNDNGEEVYSVPIAEFREVCNITNTGPNYAYAKRALKVLADKSIWVRQDDGSELLLRWIDRVRLVPGERAKFEVTFHRDMLPYLYALKEHYTQYALENVLTMRTQYGIRLYELLKSYEYMGKDVSFRLEELKKMLDAETYSRYPDFRRRVLDAAIGEINEMSDIAVSYVAEKRFNRRHIDTIIFTISKPGAAARHMRMRRKQAALSPEGRKAEKAKKKATKELDKADYNDE